MGFAGLPSTGELFAFLLVLWTVFVIIPFIIWYLRSQGWSAGPITRTAEFEEEIEKRIVLEKHGKKPDESNRVYFWWGLFSKLKDEPEELGDA